MKTPENPLDTSRTMGSIHGIEDFETTATDEREQQIRSLIGSTDERGSNEWKIHQLANIVDKGDKYRSASNNINLIPLNERVNTKQGELPLSRETREETMAVNREVLNRLYDEHNVITEEAHVYERKGPDGGYFERKIVYPTTKGFSFVESMLFNRSADPAGINAPAYFVSVIIVGTPEYSQKQGYKSEME